jgi:hypothetical protein
MPRYHFGCCNGDPIIDEDGVILPDDHTARLHAMQIIHELQKGDELAWGSLTMEVTREAGYCGAYPSRCLTRRADTAPRRRR